METLLYFFLGSVLLLAGFVVWHFVHAVIVTTKILWKAKAGGYDSGLGGYASLMGTTGLGVGLLVLLTVAYLLYSAAASY